MDVKQRDEIPATGWIKPFAHLGSDVDDRVNPQELPVGGRNILMNIKHSRHSAIILDVFLFNQ